MVLVHNKTTPLAREVVKESFSHLVPFVHPLINFVLVLGDQISIPELISHNHFPSTAH